MSTPLAPETLEGWCLLHQIFRLRWADWWGQTAEERSRVAREASAHLAEIGHSDQGATVAVALLGHKGDLMLLHLRRDFEALAATQLALNRLSLMRHLDATASFVSVVELGMYEMTAVIHERLRQRGLTPETAEFAAALSEEMAEQHRRVEGRLYCDVPGDRYVCFYPMNKRRGETRNWYQLPFDERLRLMRDHGKLARRYAGRVTQIISGATGLDDWEWGVDLFATDPLVFKKLVYELRFDEASAAYAEFGPFYVGLRFSPADLPAFLEGRSPSAPVP